MQGLESNKKSKEKGQSETAEKKISSKKEEKFRIRNRKRFRRNQKYRKLSGKIRLWEVELQKN